ncbi:MAG: aminotransferase class III-fold pyridoxal phosphate-dependent enzyme, partial [bacterium]
DSVDYVLLSKALGGGMAKIGAAMVRRSIHDPNFGILHTSTFAEDSESARLGVKSLEILTRRNGDLLKKIEEKGDYFKKELEELKKKYPGVVKDVRGSGLLIAFELVSQEKSVSMFFQRNSAQGMLGAFLAGYLLHEHRIRTLPPLNSMVSRTPVNTIRIEPSAYIRRTDIDRVVAALDRACEIISKSNAYEFSKFIIGLEAPGKTPDVKNFSKEADFSLPRAYREDARRMAFLIHPLDVHQVVDVFDHSLSRLGREKDQATGKSERELYWDIIVHNFDSFVMRNAIVRSPRTGDTVNAKFIAFPFTTQQMVELRRDNPEALVEGVQKAVDLAFHLGADLCGLGAFTSIVTNNGTALDNTFIRITSGNSYTTALVWQSVLKAADYLQLDLSASTAAVIGAGGNIGSVTASLLAEDVRRIILIGRKHKGTITRLNEVAVSIYSDVVDIIRTTKPQNLKGLARAITEDLLLPFSALNSREIRFNEKKVSDFIDKNFSGKEKKIGHLLKSLFFVRIDSDIGEKVLEAIKLKHGHDPYITATTNARKYLAEADVVVSAVSADSAFIDASWIKPGAIVNDVSLPPSISLDLYKKRPDVIAIQGGIGHLPEYINLGIPGLAVGATLGCMAETFILTMMNMIDNYSYGAITKQQVVKIWEAGKILGFGLAAIKYQDKKLTRDIVDEIKRKSKSGKKK